MSPEDEKVASEYKRDYDFMVKHREQASWQRQSHKGGIARLEVGEGLLILDFKENIKLGLSMIQCSHEYYETPQRTLFGAVLFHKVSETKEVRVYFDVISANLTHDAYAVTHYVQAVLNHEYIKQLSIKIVEAWTDGASHFRNKAVALLWAKAGIRWNYFIQYHGKSICDTRFSLISRWMYQFAISRAVNSTEDLIAAIQAGEKQARVNSNSESTPYLSFQIVTSPPDKIEGQKLDILEFDHIKSFYSFYTLRDQDNELQLYASILRQDGNASYRWLRSKLGAMSVPATAKVGNPDLTTEYKLDKIKKVFETCTKKLIDQQAKFDKLPLTPSLIGKRSNAKAAVPNGPSNDDTDEPDSKRRKTVPSCEQALIDKANAVRERKTLHRSPPPGEPNLSISSALK